ncbi:MAG: hypothetical protein HWD92_09330 [Flavobacteriia bacterium]|nr:hypothetical protein [Flavobacteriia bacterium]
MNINELIENFQKLKHETENSKFKNSLNKLIDLLKEIESKNLNEGEKSRIETTISPILDNIKSRKDFKSSIKMLRKSLMKDFKFTPANYYLTFGIGLGLAIGTSMGISLGVPFDNGIVLGQVLGASLGLVGGAVIGMFLDKNKKSENRTLKNL